MLLKTHKPRAKKCCSEQTNRLKDSDIVFPQTKSLPGHMITFIEKENRQAHFKEGWGLKTDEQDINKFPHGQVF